jgi:hypothetical protein
VNPEDSSQRVYYNDQMTIFAIKTHFEYIIYNSGSPEKIIKEREMVDLCIANLINLIGICIDKQPKTKIILQDYTGRETTNLYISLLGFFDRDDMLNHVLFDVTQKDSGCFVELTETQAPIDANGNFIQEQYLELTKITQSPLFPTICKDRINKVIYPISLNYSRLISEPGYSIVNRDLTQYFALLYNIPFESSNNTPEYLIQFHERLIRSMICDILTVKQIDPLSIDGLIHLLHMPSRSKFIDSMSSLNYG